MNGSEHSEMLDHGRLPSPSSWEAKEWVPVAYDRVQNLGAVTRIQRVTTQSFYSMTAVYIREHDRWSELFENGDQWPIDPTSPRPEGDGFAMVTGVSGAGGGERAPHFAFVAGVAASSVHGVRISSHLDEHDLIFDARTGIFVAVSLQPENSVSFELLAFDLLGIPLDRVEYSDPWSD